MESHKHLWNEGLKFSPDKEVNCGTSRCHSNLSAHMAQPGGLAGTIPNYHNPTPAIGYDIPFTVLDRSPMTLIAFLRGVNVGGHRTFRPSVLAHELSDFDVVNVGAAGTFVVRKPKSRATFLAALQRKLPFEAQIVLCDARDLLRLESDNPFAGMASSPDIVRFVSIMSKPGGVRVSLPVAFPAEEEWLVRVIASDGQFVFGTYRRHMKTIGYLGNIDKLFGVPATTRNWNTILSVLRILKAPRG